MSQVPKTIFEYDNYREFLADFYKFSKTENPRFSFRFFSRIAGFKSSNFLYLVMKGKSNVSMESAESLARAMKLNKEETSFLKNLILFNQADTSSEKQKFSKELMRSRTYKKIYPLSEAQYSYYAKWYFTAVRGLVGLPGFREDPDWIAEQLNPAITKAEAEKALQELQRLGLITRNEEGKLVQTSANVSSTNAVTSASLAQYHREMAKKAAESIDRFPRDKRNLMALTVGVSEETAEKIKEITEKCRLDIVELVSREQAPDKLYQLNIYLFPVAEIKKET